MITLGPSAARVNGSVRQNWSHKTPNTQATISSSSSSSSSAAAAQKLTPLGLAQSEVGKPIGRQLNGLLVLLHRGRDMPARGTVEGEAFQDADTDVEEGMPDADSMICNSSG